MQPNTRLLRFQAAALVGVALFALPSLARAQCASWDTSFNGSGDFNAGIAASVTFDTGGGPQLCVCGSFTYIGSDNLFGMARWNGTSWESINAPSSIYTQYYTSMVTFDDGRRGLDALLSGLLPRSGDRLLSEPARQHVQRRQRSARPVVSRRDQRFSTPS